MGSRSLENLSISVIIPYYRDFPALQEHWDINRQRLPGAEFCVVGGEEDPAAEELVRQAGGVWLVAEQPGRGGQMNAGAGATRGEVLLFLHADTRVPEGAGRLIGQALAKGCGGGAFARRFDSAARFLRLTCWLADWRGRWWGWFLGDQAIFCSREVFHRLGGYRDWRTFEDLDLARRMRREVRTTLLFPPVISSARRFAARGPVRQTWQDFRLTWNWLKDKSRNDQHRHE